MTNVEPVAISCPRSFRRACLCAGTWTGPVLLLILCLIGPARAGDSMVPDPGAVRDCVPIPLTGGFCVPRTGQPTDYTFNVAIPYWMVFAVAPSGADDKDAYVYTGPCATGTMLGYSNRSTGTDLVVGDGNHLAAGTYYAQVRYGDQTSPYAVNWNGGADILPPDVNVGGAMDCADYSPIGPALVWDVQLQAGQRYSFDLSHSGVPMALFRSQGSAYWAGRNAAEIEVGAGDTQEYVAPATDWYGAVVFNDLPGCEGRIWNFSYQLCGELPLPSAGCTQGIGVPKLLSLDQTTQPRTWIGLAVNSMDPGDFKSIAVHENDCGTGLPVEGSGASNNTNFVLGNFNVLTPELLHVRVGGGSPSIGWVLDWETQDDDLVVGVPVSVTVGGGTGSCNLIRVWDVELTEGQPYQFTLTKQGDDMRMAIFYPRANGWWYRGGQEEEWPGDGLSHVFVPVTSGTWALAVYDDSPAFSGASYTVGFDQCDAIPLGPASCRQETEANRLYVTQGGGSCWRGIAVNTAEDEARDLGVMTSCWGGQVLAACTAVEGTDFVVGDGYGTYDPVVTLVRGAADVPWTVEYNECVWLWPGTAIVGSVGGASGACGLINVFDAPLDSGLVYQFTLSTQGAADIRMALFDSAEQDPYWVSRSQAVFEMAANQTPGYFQAPRQDAYGVVLFNASAGSPSGSFTFELREFSAASAPQDVATSLSDHPRPNPARSSVEIAYRLDSPREIILEIFDAGGRQVRSMRAGPGTSPEGLFTWNTQNDLGRPVSSGVYLYRLLGGRSVQRGVITVLR